ncbi:hypothetical protein ACHAXR_002273 [Thalassiosira sp. AJA248-18]
MDNNINGFDGNTTQESGNTENAAKKNKDKWWTKIRSAIPYIQNDVDNGSQPNGSLVKKKPKRRWEVPLTSRPYQGVEELRSTTVTCILALVLYFVVGAVVFPFWLEPSWTIVDALYFSTVTLSTVGYGDVVVSGGVGPHAAIAKLFVVLFNIYAVAISVSALGIIARLALSQERKLMILAKERARRELIYLFGSEQDDKESWEEEDHDDDEDEFVDDEHQWAYHIIDDEKKKSDLPDKSIFEALLRALQSNTVNFAVLIFIAGLLRRVEKWSLIDVLYYWNCTATTIGYGDLSPQTQIGRILAIVFIPLAVMTMGQVIASVFAFVYGRIAAKAEKDFIRREITLSDLKYLDVNEDGKVCEFDFITFMLIAMQKVDRKTMRDLHHLFHALDVGKDGFIQKEDLITLRQRKRLSKQLKRDARKNERWFETRFRNYKKSNKKFFGWSLE